jgi:hypothetical protein
VSVVYSGILRGGSGESEGVLHVCSLRNHQLRCVLSIASCLSQAKSLVLQNIVPGRIRSEQPCICHVLVLTLTCQRGGLTCGCQETCSGGGGEVRAETLNGEQLRDDINLTLLFYPLIC